MFLGQITMIALFLAKIVEMLQILYICTKKQKKLLGLKSSLV